MNTNTPDFTYGELITAGPIVAHPIIHVGLVFSIQTDADMGEFRIVFDGEEGTSNSCILDERSLAWARKAGKAGVFAWAEGVIARFANDYFVSLGKEVQANNPHGLN
jgi:hypothetical protein